MKKVKLFLLLPLIAVVACDPVNQPGSTTDEIPSSFPKKHLIEHFTGEACVACPMGMAYLQEFVDNNSNCVWVSHHAGYYDDEYTIKESTTLANTYEVNGAPSMMLDRTEQTYTAQDNSGNTIEETSLVFHPGYLSELTNELPATTYASVEIKHSYDATNRGLSVTVSGLVADASVTNLTLTVLIKENDLVGEQADYSTWEGWEEFRHNKVARAFLTPATGVAVSVTDQKYSATYSYTLDDEWKAENCVIVAYITEAAGQPVVNAEQAPVVENTTGGEELVFEGIKIVEVPATYPEYIDAPSSLSGMQAYLYQIYSNIWGLEIYGSKVESNPYSYYPVAIVYVFAEQPYGTFSINSTMGENTVWAGYRDDANFYYDGSMLLYAEASTLDYYGQLYPLEVWLLTSGTVTVTLNGTFTIEATTFNGSNTTLSGQYQIYNGSSAPAKKQSFAPIKDFRMMTKEMPAGVRYSLPFKKF